MTTDRDLPASETRALRLWPGVVLVVAQWMLRFVVPKLFPDATALGVMGSLATGLGVLIWWLFFSRARWAERLGAIGILVGGFFGARALLHQSLADSMLGLAFLVYALPTVCLALVAWAFFARRLTGTGRWATMAVSLLGALFVWTLVKTGGMTGSADNDFALRWSPTAEDRLLAGGDSQAAEGGGGPVDSGPGWSGFRGPNRDGVVTGTQLATDWEAHPPEELWRRPVGPGWSSFAVRGDWIYTQEQRGENEVVSAYRASDGDLLWRHEDPVRFWEATGGAGPRSTPTLSGDLVYTFGATGILNALNRLDGSVVWRRDVAQETEAKVPYYGFTSSPLVVGDRVVVAAAGRMAAYDRLNGNRIWTGPEAGGSYSSPHLLQGDGEPKILLATREGVICVDVQGGRLVWEYEWEGGIRIVQPAFTADGDLLISEGEGQGLRRVAIDQGAAGLIERWTSNRLKPYHNDFVVHEGHAYGFDGSILASVDIETGERTWKGGRYGHGQLVLLADQDLLLVLGEKGDLVLVEATPEEFTEVARVPALEGKSWNHPVLAGELLLVRNDQEIAAFRVTTAS